MKRCPLCDFIYEDEQNLCDMDGIELVADSGPLSQSGITAIAVAHVPVLPTQSWGRRFAIPGVAAVILSAVLFQVFYVSKHRSENLQGPQKVRSGTQSAPNADPPGQGTAAAALTDSSKSKTREMKADSKASNANLSTEPSPAPKRAEQKRKSADTKPQRVSANRKNQQVEEQKDSKIGSFLKKTARILKKPF